MNHWHETRENVVALGAWLLTREGASAADPTDQEIIFTEDLQRYYEAPEKYTRLWGIYSTSAKERNKA